MYMIFKCNRILSIDLDPSLATYMKLGVKVCTDCALHHCSSVMARTGTEYVICQGNSIKARKYTCHVHADHALSD